MKYNAPRIQETICAEIATFAEYITDRSRATTYTLILDLCDELQARRIRDNIDEDEDIYPY